MHDIKPYKKPGSRYWYVKVAGRSGRSTGTEDRKKAIETGEKWKEDARRLDKLGDRGTTPWTAAVTKYFEDSRKQRKREHELLEHELTSLLEGKVKELTVVQMADIQVLEKIQKLALAEGWKHSTVNRLMDSIRAVLRHCYKRKIIEAPPIVPRYEGVEEDGGEPRFLTKDEFAALCKELPPHLALAARFSVFTLLRMRSVAYLTWDRVDLEKRTVRIPRRMRAIVKGHQKAGKPFGLFLSDEALRALKEAKAAANPDCQRVFQYDGHGVDDFNTAAFKAAALRAGIAVEDDIDPDGAVRGLKSALRWHDLRHTGASWALQNGVTLPELMALGDWKDYRSVLIYAHLAPENTESAAQKLSQSFSPSGPEPSPEGAARVSNRFQPVGSELPTNVVLLHGKAGK